MFNIKDIDINCRKKYDRKFDFDKTTPEKYKYRNDYNIKCNLNFSTATKFGKINKDVIKDLKSVIPIELYFELIKVCDKISAYIEEDKREIRCDDIE